VKSYALSLDTPLAPLERREDSNASTPRVIFGLAEDAPTLESLDKIVLPSQELIPYRARRWVPSSLPFLASSSVRFLTFFLFPSLRVHALLVRPLSSFFLPRLSSRSTRLIQFLRLTDFPFPTSLLISLLQNPANPTTTFPATSPSALETRTLLL